MAELKIVSMVKLYHIVLIKQSGSEPLNPEDELSKDRSYCDTHLQVFFPFISKKIE